MLSDWKIIAAERRRLEIAARKARDEEHCDPELEAAFVAFATYRTNGGTERFETWRADWIKARGGQDGR